MLSANASLQEFINHIAEHSFDEIILLADREATEAERYCCKRRHPAPNDGQDRKMETYALLLKDFMIYMRHGVATSALRGIGCQTLEHLPRA